MSAGRPYRIRFAGRRELDRDDFLAAHAYEPGDVLEGFREGLEEPAHAWAVATPVPGRDGRPDTLVCDVVVRPEVGVSKAAARFARARGGRIHVWAAGREGAGAAVLRASTAAPVPRRDCDRRSIDGVEVFVASDIGVPAIHVRLGLLRRGLVVEWPGGSVAT